MSRAVVEVRTTPPRGCWPNARVHWGTRATAVRELRDEAHRATAVAVLHDPEAFCWVYAAPVIVLDVEIAWAKGQRRLDDDNAIGAVKPLRDGIAAALDLDDRKMRQGSMAQTRGEGVVTVTLRESE